MSLLLDAMKKTGESKPQSAVELELEEIQPSPRKPIPSVEPATTSTAGNSNLPPPSAPPSGASATRATGQNLFAAKKAPPKRRRQLGIVPIALIAGSIFGSCYGFYVYIEITPPNQRFYHSNTPQPQHINNPVPPPIAAARPPVAAPTNPIQSPALVPLTQPSNRVVTVEVAKTPVKTAGNEKDVIAKKSVSHAQKKGSASQNASELNIQHQPEPDLIDTNLTTAYAAYQNGDLDTAVKNYRNALNKDPKNRDALLGLAAIAQEQGQDEISVQYYRRVLALDPRDPVAQAAMASFGSTDPSLKESHLKQLISQQPDSSALNFALGNQYADQARWAEAQQAYFNALAIEPNNALFAFNVAISLDHIGQRNAAVQYYRQALQFDTSGKSGFSRDKAQQRINQLTNH